MENDKMLNCIHLLACALYRVVDAMPEGQFCDGATAYMQEFGKSFAELRSAMKPNYDTLPQLHKHDVIRRSEPLPKDEGECSHDDKSICSECWP